jgi:hypothetical protein
MKTTLSIIFQVTIYITLLLLIHGESKSRAKCHEMELLSRAYFLGVCDQAVNPMLVHSDSLSARADTMVNRIIAGEK